MIVLAIQIVHSKAQYIEDSNFDIHFYSMLENGRMTL